MCWEHDLFALFDDLEGQAAAAWEADREAELADRAMQLARDDAALDPARALEAAKREP